VATSSIDTDRAVGRFAKVSSLQAHLAALPDLRDRPYSEALFTTFNVDLGYFEGHVLGPVRGAGAAVTVIADASQYKPDPLAVRSAGISYIVGVVDLSTAFHPKVAVLVGEDRLLIAVGSGNLTTGGWLGNDETLFVASGTRATGIPSIAASVADWLDSLKSLHISTAGLAGISRTRGGIEHVVSTSDVVDTGHRLVTTSVGPILDQLPPDPVDELLLHAPFHDHSGDALGALLSRYRPRRVSIAVQSGRTIIDPAALEAAAETRGVSITWHDAGDAYRHGKLVEAVTGEDRWVLTGSANLTGAALLRPLGAGGNCEVGVVANVASSLYPGEGDPLADVKALTIVSAPGESVRRADPLPVLLAATLDGDAVVVELSRPARIPVTIDVSEYNDLPELTRAVGVLPPGQTEARFVIPGGLGARSRVRVRFDTDGVEHRGPFHFVADTDHALRRIKSTRASGSNSNTDWHELFGDEGLLRAWTRTLDKITREQRAIPAGNTRPPSQTSVRHTGNRPAFDDEEAWARYSEDAIARLGPTLAHDASGGLILPHLALRSVAATSDGEPVWADKFRADETDFDDTQTADDLDDADSSDDDGLERSSPAGQVTPEQRHRLHSWIAGVSKSVEERPAIDRMTMCRLILIASLAPIWDDEAGWFPHLIAATRSLLHDDVPVPLAPEVAALSAVCLYRLSQGASPDPRTGTGLQHAMLIDDVLPVVVDAEDERIGSIVHSIYGISPLKTQPQDVIDMIDGLTDANPWPEITESIERTHPDWTVALGPEGHISIEARSGAHFRIAADVLELVPGNLTVALRVVTGKSLEERVYARHDGVLVAQDRLGQRTVWKAYRLGSLVTPAVIHGNPDTEVRARIDRPPWSGLSETVRTVLHAAGVPI